MPSLLIIKILNRLAYLVLKYQASFKLYENSSFPREITMFTSFSSILFAAYIKLKFSTVLST